VILDQVYLVCSPIFGVVYYIFMNASYNWLAPPSVPSPFLEPGYGQKPATSYSDYNFNVSP
jgi:hypothetical protein